METYRDFQQIKIFAAPFHKWAEVEPQINAFLRSIDAENIVWVTTQPTETGLIVTIIYVNSEE